MAIDIVIFMLKILLFSSNGFEIQFLWIGLLMVIMSFEIFGFDLKFYRSYLLSIISMFQLFRIGLWVVIVQYVIFLHNGMGISSFLQWLIHEDDSDIEKSCITGGHILFLLWKIKDLFTMPNYPSLQIDFIATIVKELEPPASKRENFKLK